MTRLKEISLSGPFLAKEDREQVLMWLEDRKKQRLIEKADTFAGTTVDYGAIYKKFLRCMMELSDSFNGNDQAAALKNLADASNYIDILYYLINENKLGG